MWIVSELRLPSRMLLETSILSTSFFITQQYLRPWQIITLCSVSPSRVPDTRTILVNEVALFSGPLGVVVDSVVAESADGHEGCCVCEKLPPAPLVVDVAGRATTGFAVRMVVEVFDSDCFVLVIDFGFAFGNRT